MARPYPFFPFRSAGRAGLASVLLACALSLGAAQAGVLQVVNVNFVPGFVGTPVSDTEQVFELASGDIADNIVASIGQTPPGGPGYVATASAGTFGQVGLDTRVFSVSPGSTLSAEVLIGSDEFVNVFGMPVNVSSNFIIDGGFINDPFSTGTTIRFSLQVGAQHLGVAPLETNAFVMEVDSRVTANLGGAGGFFDGFDGGSYVATYTTDAAAAPSFSFEVRGGLDLGAEFDAAGRSVQIPFSLQSLDLGTLLPGERLLLAYRAEISITQGIAEGIFAGFSDPFGLGGSSILGSLIFTPLDQPPPGGSIPSPGSLWLLAAGLLALLGVGRARGQK
jgi:hypothetical protein